MNVVDTYSTSPSFIDNVKLRLLTNNDIDDLKRLCADWFPIKYPDSWYKEVTNNSQFFSLAAVYNNETVGVIIAEIRPRNRCHKEDADILGYWYPYDTKVGYILILGASKEYRRKGVASFLLDTFLQHVREAENVYCKAVYLHVLSTNISAVLFYERQTFKRHKLLPMYYAINGTRMDGYCYVCYVNDGCPPVTFSDMLKKASSCFGQLASCHVSRYVVSVLWLLPNKILTDRHAIRMIRRI